MNTDELYGLPLDRFVAERTALVRALRTGGRRDEASEVAALRKPSVAAWAVNQLVRTQGGAVESLFAAGDRLRRAQADLIAGRGDGRGLRAAGEGERAAVERLIDAARGLLTAEGHELGAAVLDRVADTLHAAALGPEAREAVRGGRLGRELRHVGLGEAAPGLGEAAPGFGEAAEPGPGEAEPAPAPPPRRPGRPRAPALPPTGAATDRRLASSKAKPNRKKAAATEQERAAAVKAARATEARAGREVERAARAVRAAQARCARAAQDLADAEQALEAAGAQARSADDAHRHARAEVERIS